MLADALIERGWHGLACYPGSKQPASPRGVLDATADPDRLRHHFKHHPRDNLAIATGPSRLVVVDLDVRGVDGPAAFAALCEHHGHGWPRTYASSTPSGGQHLYFTAPSQHVPCSAGRLGPGIDVKASGGYVLCEPSVIGDRRYRVTLDVPPVELPTWVADASSPQAPLARVTTSGRCQMAGRCRYGLAVLRRLADEIAATAEGQREVTTYNLARRVGAFVTSGCLHHDYAVAVLADAATRAGLTEHEARHAIGDGFASRQATAGTCCPFTGTSR